MALEKHTKVLVTGAGGLIGYVVAEHLYSVGYDVVGVVRKECDVVFPTVCWDLRHGIQKITHEITGVDAVVHSAAIFPSTDTTDEESAVTNQQIDKAIFELVNHYAVPIVFMSSCSIYAHSQIMGSSWNESDFVNPQSQYARQKLESEQLFYSDNPRAISLRIPSPFGMRQTNKNVLKFFIDRALQGEPLRYHGTGMREQNFISAHDIALAVERALQTSAKGIFNIASDRAISMKELAELICTVAQPTGSIVEASGQLDEQDHIRVRISIEKAWRELGWKPSTNMLSELQEIISYRRREVHE